MVIKGANLGDAEVEYKPLTEHQFGQDENEALAMAYLQKLYESLSNEAKNTEVHPFPCDGDYVIIEPGMPNHSCTSNIVQVRSIAEKGVLASEWFGVLETELEGRFCTFIDRIKPPEYVGTYMTDKKRFSGKAGLLLFFDIQNEIMQRLLHLDYFEYVQIKITNPEKIKELYSPEEIFLMDVLIEPLSRAGRNLHEESRKNKWGTYYWAAIPGGIPSQLINGICIKNGQYSEEYIQELTQLFPNATIFNAEQKIVYKPIRGQSKK